MQRAKVKGQSWNRLRIRVGGLCRRLPRRARNDTPPLGRVKRTAADQEWWAAACCRVGLLELDDAEAPEVECVRWTDASESLDDQAIVGGVGDDDRDSLRAGASG